VRCTLLGWAGWSRDAGHGDYDRNGRLDPGDAILASDNAADRRAVQARLSTGRIASTRGHNAPYNTGWKTGNLPEGHTYILRACLAWGSSTYCSPGGRVTA
jgi:hypothetical protein